MYRIVILFLFISGVLYSQDTKCFESYKQEIQNLLKDNEVKQAKISFNNMIVACEDNLNKIEKLQKEIAKKGNYEILSVENLYAFNEEYKYDNKDIRKPKTGMLFENNFTFAKMKESYYPDEIENKKKELNLDFVKYINGEKYLLAKKDNKYGVFDLKFNEILPIEYDRINSGEFLTLTKDNKQSIFDVNTKKFLFPFYKEIVPKFYQSASNAKRFVKIYKSHNRNVGLFYLDGTAFIDFPEEEKYQDIVINEKAKIILVDKGDDIDTIYDFDGQMIASDFYFWSYQGDDERFVIKNKEGEMGVINSQGKMIIPFSFVNISNWDNFYAIEEYGKKGVKNVENNYIIPAIYDNISYPIYDTFIVEQNNKYGILNKFNQMIIPLEYDFIKKVNDDYLLYFVSKNKKVGMFDIRGKQIVPLIYDKYKISDEDENTFEFEKDGKIFKFVNLEKS